MKSTRSIAILAALGLGIGAAHAAPAGQGNLPPGQSMSAQQRKAAVATLKANHANRKQPETAAEAKATLVRQPNGTTAALVPQELWNTLAIQRDAQGRVRVLEADGTHAPTPSTEDLPNE